MDSEALAYCIPTRPTQFVRSYGIVNVSAYILEHVLALDLFGSKSIFTSRQGQLESAQVCELERPKDAIREQAPYVIAEIRQRGDPVMLMHSALESWHSYDRWADHAFHTRLRKCFAHLN